jgi:hypothetical protein
MRRSGSLKPTRKKSSSESAVSLFPFLAVLICTMGALILLLVIIAQRSSAQAAENIEHQKAQQKIELAQHQEDSRWRIGLLRESLKKTREQLDKARWQLSHIEDHRQTLQNELQLLEKSAKSLDQIEGQEEREVEGLESKLVEIQKNILQAKSKLEQTSKKGENKETSFALIPYHGPGETFRRPIYIECLSDKIILQPEGIVFHESDFRGDLGPQNPLATAMRATREYLLDRGKFDSNVGQPYPLLVVRQKGIGGYYAARAALESWDDEFGYELVDDKMKLDYSLPDPVLADIVRQKVAQARIRQRQLALAAPSRFYQHGQQPFSQFTKTGGPESGGNGSGDGNSGSGRPSFAGGGGLGGDGSSNPNGPKPGQRYTVSNTGAGVVPYGGSYGGNSLPTSKRKRPRYARPSELGGNNISNDSYGTGGGTGSGTGGAYAGNLGEGGENSSGNSSQPYGSSSTAGIGSAAGGSINQVAGGTGSSTIGTDNGTGGYGDQSTGSGSGSQQQYASFSTGGAGRSTGGGSTNSMMAGNNRATTGGSGTSGSSGASGTSGDSAINGGSFSEGTADGNPQAGAGTGGPELGNPNLAGANGTGGSSGAMPGASSGGGGGGSGTSGGGSGCSGSSSGNPSCPISISSSAMGSGSGQSFNVNIEKPEDYVAGRPQDPNSQIDPSATGTALRPGEWYPKSADSQRPKRTEENANRSAMPRGQTIALAQQRGKNWGLPEASTRATPLTRPIPIQCFNDRIVLPPSRSYPRTQTIRFDSQTVNAVDPFVGAVWDRIDAWGIAGSGMYWRPILKISPQPGSERRFKELSKLMAGSGLNIEIKK